MNSSSQTAYDIAKFWGHRHISNLLNRTEDGCQRVLPGSDIRQQENYFSREMLDRLSGKRTDRVWLEAKQSDSDSVYLLFSNLSPMVSSSQDDDDAVVGGWREMILIDLIWSCWIISIFGSNHILLYGHITRCFHWKSTQEGWITFPYMQNRFPRSYSCNLRFI